MVVVVVYLVSNKSCLTLANPWTVACQAPLSLGFPRQGYRSGLLSLLQGIFLTKELNLGPLYCRQSSVLQMVSRIAGRLLPTEPLGKPEHDLV